MSRDVVFETIGRGHRALVEAALRRGDRVFVFDFTYRLKARAWLRALINEGRVVRIYVPPTTREEGASLGAAEWLAPRLMRHPIVRALTALYGAEEVAPVVQKAVLDEVFAHLFMRAWLARHLADETRGRKVILVASAFRRWERRLARWPDRPAAALRGLRFGRWATAWTRATRRMETAARTAKAAALLSAVLAARRRRFRSEAPPPVEVDHLYAIDQPFQAKFRGGRRFTFLLDGATLHEKNTAFVVHPSAEGEWMEEARREGYLVFSRQALASTRALLREPPSRAATRGLARVLRAIMVRPGSAAWLVEMALLAVRTHLGVAKLAEHVRFTNYVYTNQDGLDQRWHNVMVRRLGGRSWNYVLSIGAGHLTEGGTDLAGMRDPLGRHRLHAFQNPDDFVVPCHQLVSYHQRHRQRVRAYHDVGNIFSELILGVGAGERRASRREWFGGAADDARVIAWFDTSYVEEPLSPARFDEAVMWYDDILRLADLRPDFRMLIKPSKADWYFTDPAFQWSHPSGAAVVDRWQRLAAHPRVHFAGSEADPSAVVAASDLTITFCYSSPTAEALGARRRGLWYEPKERWRGTLYDKHPLLVAHGFAELEAALRRLLDEMSDADYEQFLDRTVRGLVENYLDGRALTRFRSLLADAASGGNAA
jgi:hypothetical protein